VNNAMMVMTMTAMIAPPNVCAPAAATDFYIAALRNVTMVTGPKTTLVEPVAAWLVAAIASLEPV
jgi:hypothetical protein